MDCRRPLEPRLFPGSVRLAKSQKRLVQLAGPASSQVVATLVTINTHSWPALNRTQPWHQAHYPPSCLLPPSDCGSIYQRYRAPLTQSGMYDFPGSTVHRHRIRHWILISRGSPMLGLFHNQIPIHFFILRLFAHLFFFFFEFNFIVLSCRPSDLLRERYDTCTKQYSS